MDGWVTRKVLCYQLNGKETEEVLSCCVVVTFGESWRSSEGVKKGLFDMPMKKLRAAFPPKPTEQVLALASGEKPK